jgi:hypothetical protein
MEIFTRTPGFNRLATIRAVRAFGVDHDQSAAIAHLRKVRP